MGGAGRGGARQREARSYNRSEVVILESPPRCEASNKEGHGHARRCRDRKGKEGPGRDRIGPARRREARQGKVFYEKEGTSHGFHIRVTS